MRNDRTAVTTSPRVLYIGQAKNAKGKWLDKRTFEHPDHAANWTQANLQNGPVRLLRKTITVEHWKPTAS